VSYEGDAGAAVTEPPAGQQQGAGAEGVQGGQQQGQQGAGGQQQQGADDPIARLVASMDGLARNFGERFDSIEGRLPQQQQAGGQEEPEGFDLAAMLEELPDDAFGDDGQITPEGNLELIRQVARAEADAVRSEQQQAALEAEHDSYANALEQKYTKLADPQVQQQVLGAATQLANRMRQPELAANPYFFEQVFLALEAQSHAAAEVPGGQNDRGVRLEQPGGGGGPVGGGAGDGPSVQQRIVDATRSTRFRLGS
jgi:hypothetical protein